MELDLWQREALEWDGNLLLKTGRQVGKTTLMSIKASEKMINRPGSKIIVCSLTEEQAQLMIIMVLDYLQKNYKSYIKPGQKNQTKNKIILKNNSQIIARPVGNTGDALRGFTGDVLILDEVSRFPELIMTASTPTLMTTGGQIWACSTPAGKKGWFYEAYLNKNNRFKVIEATSYDVIHNRPISDSWTAEKREKAIKFLEEEQKEKSTLVYGQEYLGLFLEDLQQYFPTELIEKCCILKRGVYGRSGDNFMGCDIGRLGGDETTYEIIQRRGETNYVQVESIVKKYQVTTVTEAEIINYSLAWNCDRVGIDAGSGSLGVGIYDRLLLHDELKYRVVAMNNRKIVLDRNGESTQRIFKEDMYDNFRNMLERGELLLLDDPEIKASLQSVQVEYPDDKTRNQSCIIFGSYTHIVEGLVRACWLAKKEKINKLYITYV